MKNKDIRFNEFTENFADQYVTQHSKVAKDVSEDYKQRAINQALVELYCSGSKYGSEKNKKLIERAQNQNKERQLLQDLHEKEL